MGGYTSIDASRETSLGRRRRKDSGWMESCVLKYVGKLSVSRCIKTESDGYL